MQFDLRPVQKSMTDTLEYFMRFSREKVFRNMAYLFCDAEGVVKDISASCIAILGLDYKVIQNFEVKVSELFPGFTEEIEQFESN
jgi:hypothetical protein